LGRWNTSPSSSGPPAHRQPGIARASTTKRHHLARGVPGVSHVFWLYSVLGMVPPAGSCSARTVRGRHRDASFLLPRPQFPMYQSARTAAGCRWRPTSRPSASFATSFVSEDSDVDYIAHKLRSPGAGAYPAGRSNNTGLPPLPGRRLERICPDDGQHGPGDRRLAAHDAAALARVFSRCWPRSGKRAGLSIHHHPHP